jgi:hypothetical protein
MTKVDLKLVFRFLFFPLSNNQIILNVIGRPNSSKNFGQLEVQVNEFKRSKMVTLTFTNKQKLDLFLRFCDDDF